MDPLAFLSMILTTAGGYVEVNLHPLVIHESFFIGLNQTADKGRREWLAVLLSVAAAFTTAFMLFSFSKSSALQRKGVFSPCG